MNEGRWKQYGLSEENGQRVLDVLSAFGEVREAVLFGSREHIDRVGISIFSTVYEKDY